MKYNVRILNVHYKKAEEAMLEIHIQNVGKIKDACIELAGVTVVAGLNGTGKSTIAKSVFAAVNARKDMFAKIWADKRVDIEEEVLQWIEQNNDIDNSPFYDAHEEIAAYILAIYEREKWDSEDVSENVKKIIEKYCRDNNLLDEGIEEPVENIVKILKRSMEEYVNFFVEQYYQRVFKNQINPIGTSMKSSVSYKKIEDEKNIESAVSIENNKLSIIGKPLILQQENAIYIETHSVLDFCEEMSRRARRTNLANRVTLPTKELLDSLTEEKELTFIQQQKVEENDKIVKDIVSQVTHGHLIKNQNGNMEFLDWDVNEKIEFSNMSAGLKIFTVLQQLIENYSLKKGDVLIVDEPEVNLHPNWQVVLAEILVRVYKELGIYILVNSHSPYFIRAIEVKAAEYDCALQGRYYYMEPAENAYVSTDVSNNTDIIYDALYQPLTFL